MRNPSLSPHPADLFIARPDRERNRFVDREGKHAVSGRDKSGSTVAPDMLSGLQRWMDLAGPAVKSPTLVYGGAEAYTRQEISVRSWFAA